jgi:hypothetical protein
MGQFGKTTNASIVFSRCAIHVPASKLLTDSAYRDVRVLALFEACWGLRIQTNMRAKGNKFVMSRARLTRALEGAGDRPPAIV